MDPPGALLTGGAAAPPPPLPAGFSSIITSSPLIEVLSESSTTSMVGKMVFSMWCTGGGSREEDCSRVIKRRFQIQLRRPFPEKNSTSLLPP